MTARAAAAAAEDGMMMMMTRRREMRYPIGAPLVGRISPCPPVRHIRHAVEIHRGANSAAHHRRLPRNTELACYVREGASALRRAVCACARPLPGTRTTGGGRADGFVDPPTMICGFTRVRRCSTGKFRRQVLQLPCADPDRCAFALRICAPPAVRNRPCRNHRWWGLG